MKQYVTFILENLANNQLEEIQKLQEIFIKDFCNDSKYILFYNDELLCYRIARFYDLSHEGKKFVQMVLLNTIKNEAENNLMVNNNLNDRNLINYIIKKLEENVSLSFTIIDIFLQYM